MVDRVGHRPIDGDDGHVDSGFGPVACTASSKQRLQLVEQGRLQLDTPASAACPDLGTLEVLEGFDADGAPITRPPASPITLHQLLTHTSGRWATTAGSFA